MPRIDQKKLEILQYRLLVYFSGPKFYFAKFGHILMSHLACWNLKKFGVPHLATYIFFLFFKWMNQALGENFDSGMALTPSPSSLRWDLNPQPFNHESSLLTTRPGWRPTYDPNKFLKLWYALSLALSYESFRRLFRRLSLSN